MKKILSLIKKTIIGVLLTSKNNKIRAIYWNLRAKDIDEKWGKGTGDFEVIKRVLNLVKPRTLMDIGCGSGRLFPLYDKTEKIFAQDISKNAIKICKKNYPFHKINYLCKDLSELNFEKNYFDLIISNRVLSAVLPEKIEPVLIKLAAMAKYIYINEMTDSDNQCETSDYWFKHDCHKILLNHNFKIVETGLINKQTWYLLQKIES